VLLSWIILDEKPLWTTILGGSVAILAVYTINFGRRLIDKIRMRNIL
jgi:drug/metabolite transporter (DMT)-like permease